MEGDCHQAEVKPQSQTEHVGPLEPTSLDTKSPDQWTTASSGLFVNEVPWKELTSDQKLRKVFCGICKGIGLVTCLYFFICSLDTLSRGFRIVGGRTTSQIFRNSKIIQNPVVGVMVGITVTVLLQSSSATSSIIVSMVAADFLRVRVAIPLVMGANIGTSITNTFVALTQVGDREQFKRAFAGATVHDMFNWLTVMVLMPLELSCGYLEVVSEYLASFIVSIMGSNAHDSSFEILEFVTKPLVNSIVQVDSAVVECWSNPNCTVYGNNASLIKRNCTPKPSGNTIPPFRSCKSIFTNLRISDPVVGSVLIFFSLLVLVLCLVLIVEILSSILQGSVARVIKKTVNAKIKYVPWITGYLAILVGAFMTFLIQSSSVFTSALTPLVGLGIISLETMYPLTLGSNLGTTTTALIASLSVEGRAFKPSVQIALCHYLFNLTGILLFYPVPIMRFPIAMARFLGSTTAKYRWFAAVYIIVIFGALPGLFMGLSFAGNIYVIVAASAIILFASLLIVMNLIMDGCPEILPAKLRTWEWAPLWLTSLEPYDRLLLHCSCKKVSAKTSSASVLLHRNHSVILVSEKHIGNMQNTSQEKDKEKQQDLTGSKLLF